MFDPVGSVSPFWRVCSDSDPKNPVVIVQIRPNESLEAAIRRFKRQCNYSGIFKSLKANSFFEKPKVTRRLAKIERARTIKQAERMRRRARF